MKRFLAVLTLSLALMAGCGTKRAMADTVGGASGTIEVKTDEIGNLTSLVDDDGDGETVVKRPCQFGDVVVGNRDALPAATIVDDYISGRYEFRGTYYTVPNDTGWIRAEIFTYEGGPTKLRTFCPGAVADEGWNYDDVYRSYLDHDGRWAVYSDYSNPTLFSSDYQTCYEVDEDTGWFLVNDIRYRHLPANQQPDLGPDALIELYQSGGWEDNTLVWSEDWSTRVEIGSHGGLEYTYDVGQWDDKLDVLGIAYDNYKEPPACMVSSVGAYPTKVHSNMSDTSRRRIEMTVECYVDLPQEHTIEDYLYHRYDRGGYQMYVVQDDHIDLYKRGVLLDSWSFGGKTMAKYPWIDIKADKGVFAQLAEDSIVQLLPDGKTKVVLANVFGCFSGGEGIGWFLGLQDGVMSAYDVYTNETTKIASNVKNAQAIEKDFRGAVFFTNQSGTVYGFDWIDAWNADRAGEAVEIHQLDEKSIDYCIELYNAGLLELGAWPESD